MRELPEGLKSHVVLVDGGRHVKKTCNANGDLKEKYTRKTGFYLQYGDAEKLPYLVDHQRNEYITLDMIDTPRLRDPDFSFGTKVIDSFRHRGKAWEADTPEVSVPYFVNPLP